MSYIYPSLEELLSSPDRQSFLEVRRSLRSILSGFALFILSSIAVFILKRSQDFIDLGAINPVLGHIDLAWTAIVPAVILLEIIRRYHDDLYIFKEEQLTHHDGRLSLKFKMPSVRYSHIRCIVINQDIIGRIFDYGDISLGTAAQDEVELTMHGVRSPEELARLIEGLQLFYRQRSEITSSNEERTEPSSIKD
jgi:membrane protein YdbS with pleckstrin-like domain